MQKPLISIITVVLNSVETIEKTIKSIIGQSFTNYEYIIIDGGSNDGTIDIIRKYSSYISYWISEPDKGIYDAMNKGIAYAKGEYIGILNSDDWYVKNSLSTIANQIQNNPNIDIIYGNILRYYSESNIVVADTNHRKLYKWNSIGHSAAFVRKECYLKRNYKINYKIGADYDFFLWCLVNKYTFVKVNENISYFTYNGVSSIPKFSSIFELYPIWKEHLGFSYTLYHFPYRFIRFFLLYIVSKPLYLFLGHKNYRTALCIWKECKCRMLQLK